MSRLLGVVSTLALCACNSIFGVPDVTQTDDLCGAGLAVCAPEATCANTADSYTCTCNAGFTGDGKTCSDIDECMAAQSPCDVHATCTNTVGSYTCACDADYGGDGVHCAPTTFTKIVAAGDFVCGIGGDGSLYCWGANGLGQLGDGSFVPHAWPARVGTQTNWIDVSAMFLKVCATNSFHETWCWGLGTEGELGNGSNADSAVPVSIANDSMFGHSATPLAVGRYSVCGVVSQVGSGSHPLDCWGETENDTGTATVYETSPKVQPDNDWLAVAVGTVRCGLRADGVTDGTGTLWCWGKDADSTYGTVGQLGTGSDNAITPTQVGTARWKRLSLGYFNACGIQSDGSLWCWGNNPFIGALQYGDVPMQIGADTHWTAVSVSAVSIAGIDDGTLEVWGDNTNGEIGLPAFRSYATPQPFTAMPTGWTQITAGNSAVCGIQTSGTAYCWGDILDGNLGNGVSVNEVVPTRVDSETYSAVTSGNISCAITTAGGLECWGFAPNTGVGTGDTAPVWAPAPVGTGTWSEVSASVGIVTSTCGLVAGALYCWGDNGLGQLGVASPSLVTTPMPITPPAGVTWAHVAVGAHSCAVSTTGALYCWGNDASGQLGDGGTGHSATPVHVAGTWRAVSVGEIYTGDGGTCAIDANGGLFCWGLYLIGTPTSTTPNKIANGTWTTVSEGVFELCAINTANELWCGGAFSGNDSHEGRNTFAKVGGSNDWSTVSVGNEICAVKKNGTLWCFGNSGIQLGNGYQAFTHSVDDPNPAPAVAFVPTQIGTDSDWVSVDTRGSSCATKTDGSLWCWGPSASTTPQLTATPTAIP